MKLLLPLVVVGVVLCVVLFITGAISPDRSRRWQGVTGRWLRKGESKGDESAGRVGDMTRDAFAMTRRASEASADRGRKLHSKLAREDEESRSERPGDRRTEPD